MHVHGRQPGLTAKSDAGWEARGVDLAGIEFSMNVSTNQLTGFPVFLIIQLDGGYES